MILPKGFLLSGINCGLKKKKLDLGLICCDSFARATGFFTTSVNTSYSVTLSKKNISKPIKAILTNSGNANCFSHKDGLKDTEKITGSLAKLLGVKKENILIASTGIIGKKMPKEKIIKGLPKLIMSLDKKTENFSSSIMTTDTFRKVSHAKAALKNGSATILGFCKGAGMICPDMATLLSFVLTDVNLPLVVFRKIAKEAVEKSFNSITVDGCMSTNDTIFFLSSGKVNLSGAEELNIFAKKIKEICLNLAKMIVRDGEGASKFIEILVKNAKTKKEAKKAAFSIANSNLMKTAIYGANPNWGRVVAALGHAGVKLNEGKYSILMSSLKKKDIKIAVDLKSGSSNWAVYTSDLTPEYIKINAEYS